MQFQGVPWPRWELFRTGTNHCVHKGDLCDGSDSSTEGIWRRVTWTELVAIQFVQGHSTWPGDCGRQRSTQKEHLRIRSNLRRNRGGAFQNHTFVTLLYTMSLGLLDLPHFVGSLQSHTFCATWLRGPLISKVLSASLHFRVHVTVPSALSWTTVMVPIRAPEASHFPKADHVALNGDTYGLRGDVLRCMSTLANSSVTPECPRLCMIAADRMNPDFLQMLGIMNLLLTKKLKMQIC